MLQSSAAIRTARSAKNSSCCSLISNLHFNRSRLARSAHFESRLRFIKHEVAEGLKERLVPHSAEILSSPSGKVFVGDPPRANSTYSGISIEASSNGNISVSKGSFRDGTQNGRNVLMTAERYTEGEFSNGAPSGFSRSLTPREDDLWYLTDEIMEGDRVVYKESLTAQPTSRAVEILSNDTAMKDDKGLFGKVSTAESHYIGQVSEGSASGCGMNVSASGGQVFVGEFDNGMPHGYGREQRRDVGTYEGRWECGRWTVGRLQLNSKLLPTTDTSKVQSLKEKSDTEKEDLITYQGEFFRELPHGYGVWRHEKAQAEWGGVMSEGEWCGTGAGVYTCPDLEYSGDRFLTTHKRGGRQAHGVIRSTSSTSSTAPPTSRVMYEGCVAVSLLEGGAAIDLRSDGAGVEYTQDNQKENICSISHGERVVERLDRSNSQIENAVCTARKSEELARSNFALAKGRDEEVGKLINSDQIARFNEFIEQRKPKLEELQRRLASERSRFFSLSSPVSTPPTPSNKTHHQHLNHAISSNQSTESWIRHARAAVQRIARLARAFNLPEGATQILPEVTAMREDNDKTSLFSDKSPFRLRPHSIFGDLSSSIASLTKSDPTLAKICSENSINLSHLLEYYYTLPVSSVIPRVLHELPKELKVPSSSLAVFLSEVLRTTGLNDDRLIDQLIRSTNPSFVNSAIQLATTNEKLASPASLLAAFFAGGNVSHLAPLLHDKGGEDGLLTWYAYQHNAILEVCHSEIKRCEEKGEDSSLLEAVTIAAELARLLWQPPHEQNANKCLRLLTSSGAGGEKEKSQIAQSK